MEHVLLVAALTDRLRSGISVARDYFSIMMLIKRELTRLPSIQMEDTCCLHQTIQPSRYGI